jgi:hypothetical protein
MSLAARKSVPPWRGYRYRVADLLARSSRSLLRGSIPFAEI